MKLAIISILATMAALAHAHGYFLDPQGRQPGDAMKAACGAQAYSMMASDINGNIQGLEQLVATQKDYNPAECHFWECKGMKFADNTARVQHYTPNQRVPLYFGVRAKHSGFANVSIIDTATNSIIAPNLARWDEYAMTSQPLKDSWEHFSVTMPSLGSKCVKAGECVLQMYWDSPEAKQTYESCIDFTMDGDGDGDDGDEEGDEDACEDL